MTQGKAISHLGTIIAIENEKISVRIQSHSACGSCHSKSLCHIAGTNEKIIEINSTNQNIFELGETVNVKTALSTGNKAVLLGYVVPLLVLLTTMFVSNYFLRSESIAGVLAIVATGIYYFFLWLIRNKIKKKIIFQIEKIML